MHVVPDRGPVVQIRRSRGSHRGARGVPRRGPHSRPPDRAGDRDPHSPGPSLGREGPRRRPAGPDPPPLQVPGEVPARNDRRELPPTARRLGDPGDPHAGPHPGPHDVRPRGRRPRRGLPPRRDRRARGLLPRGTGGSVSFYLRQDPAALRRGRRVPSALRTAPRPPGRSIHDPREGASVQRGPDREVEGGLHPVHDGGLAPEAEWLAGDLGTTPMYQPENAAWRFLRRASPPGSPTRREGAGLAVAGRVSTGRKA